MDPSSETTFETERTSTSLTLSESNSSTLPEEDKWAPNQSSSPQSDPILIDQRYEIVEIEDETSLSHKVGTTIIKARHILLDTYVALKRLPIPSSTSKETEGQRLSSLVHKNIVGINDSFISYGQKIQRESHSLTGSHKREVFEPGLYLVMDWVNLDLTHFIKQHGTQLKFADLHKIAIGILRALDFIHSRGFIHRDIKPENVGIQANAPPLQISDIKLIDFGQVSPLGTRGGGTLKYQSPEQLKMEPLDQKTDIFSLGVLLEKLKIEDTHRMLEIISKMKREKPSERPTAREAKLIIEKLPLDEQIENPTWCTMPTIFEAWKGSIKKENIVSRWNNEINTFDGFPEELMPKYRECIQRLEEALQKKVIFNRNLTSLKTIHRSRRSDSLQEIPTLEVSFGKNDYLHVRAINEIFRQLPKEQKEPIRKKCKEIDPSCWSVTMGAHITIRTTDNQLLFTKRAKNTGFNEGMLQCGAAEGMDAQLDIDEDGNPCLFKLAQRAIYEELGFRVPMEFIFLTGIGIEAKDMHWGISGYADLKLWYESSQDDTKKIAYSSQYLTSLLKSRIIQDGWEIDSWHFVPLNPKALFRFANSERARLLGGAFGVMLGTLHNFYDEVDIYEEMCKTIYSNQ